MGFVRRYKKVAGSFKDDEITSKRKGHTLFPKLPEKLQGRLSIIKFDNCTLDRITERVNKGQEWLAISNKVVAGEPHTQYTGGGPVKIDHVTDHVTPQGSETQVTQIVASFINFPHVSTVMAFLSSVGNLARSNRRLRTRLQNILWHTPESRNRDFRVGARNLQRGGSRGTCGRWMNRGRRGRFIQAAGAPSSRVNERQSMEERTSG